MVERRKKRKRKDDGTDYDRISIPEKPSKEEYAVAKWIRNNVPSKKTKFDKNHMVEYFTGTRAVDALLENSPWNKTIFESRQHVVDLLELMLRHKFFHRAKKIVIKEDELSKLRNIKKKVKDDKKSTDKTNDEEKDKTEDKEKEKEKETKRKPKVRLEMHLEQCFVDCNDAYVWIYEPVSVYYWFFGALLVLGAIGLCLFPLWPSTVRHRVWYLSIAAAIFLTFILALIVIRIIVFCLIWVLTFGRHHFLILPNLIEDVGFFASFWPLYKYEYHGPNSEADKKSLKKKKRKKDKDSESEDSPMIQSDDKAQASEDQEASNKMKESKASNEEDEDDDEDEEEEEEEDEKSNAEAETVKCSEEASDDSDKSHTGEDFEML